MPVNPTTDHFSSEAKLMNNLQEALPAEETLLKQKSRVNWLKKEDTNNRYFYNSCKGRWNTNKILMLKDDNGVVHTSHSDISEVAINYYKSLLGQTSSVDVIPEDSVLPQLNEAQRSLLAAEFLEIDVLNTMKKMAKNKCPGLDGFSVEFYVAAWSVVGRDVTKGLVFL